jgi:hypothetical protein
MGAFLTNDSAAVRARDRMILRVALSNRTKAPGSMVDRAPSRRRRPNHRNTVP